MKFGLALPHYSFNLTGRHSNLTGRHSSPSSRHSKLNEQDTHQTQDSLWTYVRDWALKAEQLGFDSIWVSDHLFIDLEKYGGTSEKYATLESTTMLAALAACTQRVRIGSLVLLNELRHPIIVAKIAAALQLMSQGRLEVGLGAGWYRHEFETAGLAMPSPGERIERLGEAVEIIKECFRSPYVSYKGNHFELDSFPAQPQPQTPPRVWIGGKGNRVVRTAARYADGFNTAWIWEPEEYAKKAHLLDVQAEQWGRNPLDIARSVGLYTLVAPSQSGLEDGVRRYRESSPEGTATGVNAGNWTAGKLVGTTQQCVERIESFEALGVDEIICNFGVVPFQIADAEAVEIFSEEILSRRTPAA